jgi:hypothetical protein
VRELAQGSNGMARLDLSAQGAKLRGECVGDRLRAAAGKRPACDVTGHKQNEAEPGAAAPLEWQKRMCSGSGKERTGRLGVETRLGESARRAEAEQPEASEQQRAAQQIESRPDEWSEQLPVRVSVASERRLCLCKRPPQEDGSAVIERVCERRRRFDPIDIEWKRAEKGRDGGAGMDRRADVVAEPGQRQLGGARAAADRLLRLDDADGAPGLRERDCGSEPVRPRADNYSV